MSRIGRQSISIPNGVTITIDGKHLTAKGTKGEATLALHGDMEVKQEGTTITVARKRETTIAKAMHGTTRSLINNTLLGVSTGWDKTLELVGVGYRASLNGKDLSLTVGFSHPVIIPAPEGITFSVKQSFIVVSGMDKQQVGEVAAQIRRVRPPEPYKGKGIKYQGERIRRKAGKAAKAAGGAAK